MCYASSEPRTHPLAGPGNPTAGHPGPPAAPGQRLIERELVELTGVSRTSVREALRELAAEGLVTAIPDRGTVVTSVSAEEARQLYEVRSSLEALAGRLFVQHASPAQRKALARALERVESWSPRASRSSRRRTPSMTSCSTAAATRR